MPSEGAIILGGLAAFFLCMTVLSYALSLYFKKKAEEDEAKDSVSSTWSAAPGPSPSPAPAPAPEAASPTTSTYSAEPKMASWKFNPSGYESD